MTRGRATPFVVTGRGLDELAKREPDGDRLARARLRRDAEIAAGERLVEHRLLHRGQARVALLFERACHRRPDHVP